MRYSLTLLAPLLAATLGGCIIVTESTVDDPDFEGGVAVGGTGGATTDDWQVNASSTIDTAATVPAEPGTGAGVFVEYRGNGEWSVRTTCDFQISRTACQWDILARGVTSSEQLSQGFSDSVSWYGTDGAQILFETADEVDSALLFTPVGQPLTLDVQLDGRPVPDLIFWVGDGGIHLGASAQPLQLTPSSVLGTGGAAGAGGTSVGGEAGAGGAELGGSGGAPEGGVSNGGTNSGGTASGGTDSGGTTSSGGTASGGTTATGGTSAGGSDSGGATATGGTSSGGAGGTTGSGGSTP